MSASRDFNFILDAEKNGCFVCYNYLYFQTNHMKFFGYMHSKMAICWIPAIERTLMI